MQPTQLILAIFALFSTTAIATPTPAPDVSLEARGFICDFLGSFSGDACNSLCKQEGNGKGGHCIGTLIWHQFGMIRLKNLLL
jgi:hypothetical protein